MLTRDQQMINFHLYNLLSVPPLLPTSQDAKKPNKQCTVTILNAVSWKQEMTTYIHTPVLIWTEVIPNFLSRTYCRPDSYLYSVTALLALVRTIMPEKHDPILFMMSDYQKRSVVHIPKVEVSIVGHGVGLPVVQGLQGGQQHPEQFNITGKKSFFYTLETVFTYFSIRYSLFFCFLFSTSANYYYFPFCNRLVKKIY